MGEARQRRLCRFMLDLPPETVYHHVREGLVTVAGLGVVLAVLTPTVLVVRRRYRHVVAGAFVLRLMLGLLAAAVHRSGSVAPVGFVVGPTPSAIAGAASPR